ncbi:MAG: Gfo/Idh/MocA family oxidoreductase [Acidimicrobiia bacterium]|nr:Gfo/Idh/MocA family oxidoreductase [Acidimicrobiia bacterium]
MVASPCKTHEARAGSVVTVKVGFIGAGHIATYHGKSLRRSGADHVIAAVYDVDPSRARAFAQASGAEAMGSEAAVMAAVDALYVCTWTSEHPRVVMAAAARGLPLFCEKPLAITLDQARSAAAAVVEAGVINQVGLVLRSSPAFLELEHQLADPANGRVQAVVLRDDQYLPVQGMYGSSWRADQTKAGAGTLLEHSIHDVDALEWLIGPMRSVSARSSTFHGHPGIEDTMVGSMEFAGGAQGTLVSVWHQLLERPSLRRLEVICEHAFITLEHDAHGPVTWIRSDGSSGSLEGQELLAAVSERSGGRVPNQDRGFVEAVATGAAGDHPDLLTAVRAHEVVDAMYRSAASGGNAVPVG